MRATRILYIRFVSFSRRLFELFRSGREIAEREIFFERIIAASREEKEIGRKRERKRKAELMVIFETHEFTVDGGASALHTCAS